MSNHCKLCNKELQDNQDLCTKCESGLIEEINQIRKDDLEDYKAEQLNGIFN